MSSSRSANAASSAVPSYSPPFAPRVCGVFPEPERDDEGAPVPSVIALSCAACEARDSVRCTSGHPRRRVALWALLHAGCVTEDRSSVTEGGGKIQA